MSTGLSVIRALFSFFAFVALTFVGSVMAIPTVIIDRTGNMVLWLARVWSRAVLRAAGVRLEVQTHAVLDPKQPYVVMANHLSAVDIWAVFLAVPLPLRFIAKKQLGQIPLFGWAMKAGKFIFIDRQNAAAARRSIEVAAQRVREGTSVVIFPEGTRSLSGRLAPFKKGAFHLAISAEAAVVPVAIRGSRRVMPSGSALIYPGVVEIEIGEPIPTTGMGPEDRDRLLASVYERIASMLDAESGPEPGAPMSASSPKSPSA